MRVRHARAASVLTITAAGSAAAVALVRVQEHTRSLLRTDATLSGPALWLPWAILFTLVASTAVATLLFFRHSADNARLTHANGRLDVLASMDGLTGVWNRRHIDALLHQAHSALNGESWLSVLMIDIDHFKRINDTFGHAAGDKTLVTVVGRLSRSLRQGDLLGRWGGEEFLVVLPHTDLFAAQLVAERLREAIGMELVSVGTGGDEISVSVSIGVASTLDRSPELLVHTADRALYNAKAAGRDRVMS